MVKPADGLRDPGLIIKVNPSLLLWVSCHIRHCLEVPGLGLEPLVDEQLRVLGEAEEKLPTCLQAVDGLHRLVDLVVQGLNLLLRSSRQQKVVHLSLQSVINLRSLNCIDNIVDKLSQCLTSTSMS